MTKSPFEIRLDLLTEARLILQAQCKAIGARMPTTEEIINEAEKLNRFVSKKSGDQC